MNTDNNNNKKKKNRQRTVPARTQQTAYPRIKPTHTVVPQPPLLVWDGTQYQLDYNHNHRSISTWDGTTHTDIVYDDDDDYNGTNDYTYGDPFNMTDSSNQLQFTQCLKTVQFQNSLQATQHIDTTPQATPDANQHKHATTTTMKEIHNEPIPTYTYDTLQLSFLTTHYEKINDYYADEFLLYTVPQYITRKQHPSHDNYLYRRWNNPIAHKHKTTKTCTKRQRLHATNKDDTSITPTVKTLCTINTNAPHQHDNADMLISITIWNQPIVQYRMPIWSTIRKQSQHPSTTVQYALIGVYDKLNSSKIPSLLLFFTSIICVVLSCFILLADASTMVKINDRYPDEWND